MKRFTPPVEGNVRSRTDFLISSVLVQICWILLLYLFMHSSAYAHTDLYLSDGRFFQTTMCDNVIEGGEIRGDETGCDDPVFDPTLIENVSLPTGGSGTLEYLWIFTTDDPDGEFSVWTPIMNTNSPSYNPPAITETTHYRRCARRSGCEDYVAESNYVTKEVACCDNVTDGGAIRMDQTFCGNVYDPEPLVNVSLPTGGSGDLEYLWFESNVGPPFFPDNPNWTEIIGSNEMNYDPGVITQTTYYIRCSRRSGCTTFTGESNIIRITLSDPPTLNVMVTPPNCPNQNSGSIRLQVIGGMTPFNYTWTGGIGNTGNPTNLNAGTYAVTVTDANGCETNTQITLNDPPALQLNLSSTNAGCGDANNGSATANVTGGTAPYSYQWNDEDNSTTATVNNLGAGSYRVIVTDRNGCSTMGSVTIDANEDFDLNIDINNADCANQSSGSATVTPNGGIAPYTYQWNDPAEQTTSTATNLAAGSYFVSVFDANNCLTIGNVMIEEPTELNVNLNSTSASCEGGNNGTATASVTGGTPPYAYQWDDLARQTTATATNLAPGVYRLTTTDANGCIDKSQVTVGGATGFEVKVIITNVDCNDPNSGSAMATVSTGSGSYAYQWNTNATTQTISDLAIGTYIVTVTDNNTGCSAVASGMVESTDNFNLTISKNDATCGANNGSATANVMGGAAPYTYIWSNNQTTRTISNLTAGTYSVTVADNRGCTATANVQVLDDGNLNLTINKNDATCGLNNGAATVSATGGTAPYIYRWSNNQTTPTINNLAAGTYSVTVTDNRGCMATANVQILGTNNLSVSITQNNASCEGGSNGSATANPTNGTAPYTYRWSNNQTTRTISNLASGNYTVTITDTNGCTAIASTTISSGNPVVATIMPGATSVCLGETVQFTATPNASNFTYQWTATGGSFDNPNVANPTYSMMQPGTYTITVRVRRDDGCEDMAMTTVTINAHPNVTIQPPAPDLCGGGSVDFVADVSGSVNGLTYEWAATGGIFNNNTLAEPTYTMNQIGTYTITVTVMNASGCTATAETTITVSEEPTCDAIIVSDYDGLDISTYNGTDGSASVNVAGGSGNYTYRWSNGQTTQTINNLGPGSYRVTVTDGNSCQCISSVRLRDAAKIGNFVWNDIDKDGVQDANEPGIPNVLVTLTGTDINGNEVTRSVRTDATGMYMFDGLVPGDYKLTFTQPNGFRATEQNQGGNDASDSDIDPVTGMTQVVTLDYGDYDETLDAGYFDSGVNVGDYVFIDSNRNGIQDPDESGLSDVILVLIDKGADNIYGTSDDRAIDQTSTDFFGFYLFEDVPVGNYVIQIVRNSLPRDFQLTTQNAGSDDTADSDFDVNTLVSDMFMVNETQADDLTHDAGVFGVCDNVTDPGEIAADEDVCGAGSIPSLITSVRDASGGGGALEYLWMRSTVSVFNGFDDPNWEIITGATSATYQPEQIYETTYYIRCSRRANCPDYRETNIIQKKVIAYPTSDLESGSTNVCINESTTYVAEIGGFGNITYDWHFGDDAVPQTASGRAATVRWTTGGTKVVSLNVIQDGCANYTTYEINVSDCPGLLGNFTTVEAELTPEAAVDLMWMTDGEPVNTNYVIQRANADGSKFETIDLMPAKGEKAMQTYHCVDKKPNIGKNYYRVKHFDLNGGFVYSNVVEIMVQPQGTKDVIFYPNPFRDRTTLQVVAEVETDVQVQIVSTFGQVIEIQTIPLGTNFYDLDLSEYPKGVYYVYVTYNGYRKVSYRLLKTDDN